MSPPSTALGWAPATPSSLLPEARPKLDSKDSFRATPEWVAPLGESRWQQLPLKGASGFRRAEDVSRSSFEFAFLPIHPISDPNLRFLSCLPLYSSPSPSHIHTHRPQLTLKLCTETRQLLDMCDHHAGAQPPIQRYTPWERKRASHERCLHATDTSTCGHTDGQGRRDCADRARASALPL